VLGEQSAKTLRGTHMQDVIFAGTRERKALGMAEVTLTMVDPEAYEGPIPVEPLVLVDHDGPTDWDEERCGASGPMKPRRLSPRSSRVKRSTKTHRKSRNQ